MTKNGGKSERAPQLEIGLVYDHGSSRAGVYGLTDLFRYAGDIAKKRWNGESGPTIRISHWEATTDSSGVRCTYDSDPEQPHAPSVVLLPGNELAPFDLGRNEKLLDWLRDQHSKGVILGAVCGGVFILGKTGLLAGRQATTHWSFRDHFAKLFPDILTECDRMVIEYPDILTAGGVLAWSDMGLRIVERLLGNTIMHDTARFMLVDPPGREQRFYSGFDPKMSHGDAPILKAQEFLSRRLASTKTIAEMARYAGLEPRTFLRRFAAATGMKPTEYHQRLRINRARELLEFSRRSIDAIAVEIGYNDVGGFRQLFRKIVGLSPSDYRRRFSGTASTVRKARVRKPLKMKQTIEDLEEANPA